jgi:hypothetical protein
VFGFNESATALKAYYDKALRLGGKVSALREGQMELDAFAPLRTDLLTSADSFRSTITKAFANL